MINQCKVDVNFYKVRQNSNTLTQKEEKFETNQNY